MTLDQIVGNMIDAGASKESIMDVIRAGLPKLTARQRQNQRAYAKRKGAETAEIKQFSAGAENAEIKQIPAEIKQPSRVVTKPSKKEITGQKENIERSPNGSRLPKDFVPEPGIASGLGLTRREFEDQFALFKDHWTAKAGKDARKVDWQATWRNWCRRALKFRKPEREKNYAEQFSDMMENGHEKADDDGRADEAGDWSDDRRIGSGEGSQFERYDFPLLGDGKNGKH